MRSTTLVGVRTEIEPLLRRAGGVTTRARLLTVLTRNELDDEIRRGRLVVVFPRVYGRPWTADDPSVLDRAALTSVGQPAVLSHVTALRRWRLAVPPEPAVHVAVPVRRHPVSIPGRLVIHRLRSPFPASFRVDGLPTQNLPAALCAAWPLLDPRRRRAPVIEAVRRRLVTPAQIERAIGSVTGAGELRELVGLLAAGCESELEIFGLVHVFDAPGLRHAVRQKWVRAGGRNHRLDIAFEQERVAVELDGFATHGTRDRREADLARDAALAAAGWLTIRFSYERLTKDPEGCRREVLAALAARRAWRRSG